MYIFVCLFVLIRNILSEHLPFLKPLCSYSNILTAIVVNLFVIMFDDITSSRGIHNQIRTNIRHYSDNARSII